MRELRKLMFNNFILSEGFFSFQLCWAFAAEDNLAFILGWYAKFPEYKKNEFYLTGESFAGNVKTIPFHLCISYYYYYYYYVNFYFFISLGFNYNR
jgi:hypothetical protein